MMIFISRVISIIILKNTLCTNKSRVIYFCPNGVNFLPENVHFFYCWGVDCPPAPPPSARGPMPLRNAFVFRVFFDHSHNFDKSLYIS